MKKVIYIGVVLFMTLMFSSVALAAIPVDVTMGKGTILTLKRNSERISLANPAVADLVLISPTELLINGKSVGTTGLIIWDREGERTFFDINVMGDLDDLRTQINNLAPDEQITVDNVSGSILLKGTVGSDDTIKKVNTLSEQYASKIINFMKVKRPQQVMLEVKVAQIDRTKLSEFGLSALYKGNDYEGTLGLVGMPGGNVGGPVGTDVTPGIEGFDLGQIGPQIGVASFDSGIAGVLKALAGKGLGTILAEPNLVVRSGEKGSFLAGSRIPVQTVTGTGGAATVSITYEEVGVKLNFEPNVLDDGTIRLKLDPAEVSNINQFITFNGILAPQIDTREVRTSVDLKEGESLILAGLLSEETKKNISKIPLLGDIPILGALFRSTREDLERTELVFFITPKLVSPMAPGERPKELLKEPVTKKEERQYRWIPIPGGSEEKKADEDQGGTEEEKAAE
jgi:pilus assembly protein CpaC